MPLMMSRLSNKVHRDPTKEDLCNAIIVVHLTVKGILPVVHY